MEQSLENELDLTKKTITYFKGYGKNIHKIVGSDNPKRVISIFTIKAEEFTRYCQIHESYQLINRILSSRKSDSKN